MATELNRSYEPAPKKDSTVNALMSVSFAADSHQILSSSRDVDPGIPLCQQSSSKIKVHSSPSKPLEMKHEVSSPAQKYLLEKGEEPQNSAMIGSIHGLNSRSPINDQVNHGKSDSFTPQMEDSFVKSQLVAVTLKRASTPKFVIPPSAAVDKKLVEIGDIVDMNEAEKFEDLAKASTSLPCCYSFRSMLLNIRHEISSRCLKIISHSYFETISILVILINCVTLALDDPTTDVQDNWQIVADYVFQALYSLELILKVLGMGFVMNSGSYLRDPWNVLDFVIVAFGYLGYLQIGGGLDLKALRSFRVMRPLRTITSIEGLKILMSALVSSLPLLMDTIVILLFFYTIFAIAGLQLWHGILRKRCLNIETGDVDDSKTCGYQDCGEGSICVTYLSNPNWGATNFDNIFSALLTVYQSVTLEGWTDTQLNVVRAFGPYAVIYFTPLVFIGAFFLINFTLAVIKSRVTTIYQENRELKLKKKNKEKKKLDSILQDNDGLMEDSNKNLLVANMVQYVEMKKQEKGKESITIKLKAWGLRHRSTKKSLAKKIEKTPKELARETLGFDIFDDETETNPSNPPAKESGASNISISSLQKIANPIANLVSVLPLQSQPQIPKPSAIGIDSQNQQKEEKKPLSVVSPHLHEEVIKEENEEKDEDPPLNESSFFEEEAKGPKAEPSARFMANFKKSLAKPKAKEKKFDGREENKKSIEVKKEDKKLIMRGMAGIATIPLAVQAIFSSKAPAKNIADLDEFTETFFNGRDLVLEGISQEEKHPALLSSTNSLMMKDSKKNLLPENSYDVSEYDESRAIIPSSSQDVSPLADPITSIPAKEEGNMPPISPRFGEQPMSVASEEIYTKIPDNKTKTQATFQETSSDRKSIQHQSFGGLLINKKSLSVTNNENTVVTAATGNIMPKESPPVIHLAKEENTPEDPNLLQKTGTPKIDQDLDKSQEPSRDKSRDPIKDSSALQQEEPVGSTTPMHGMWQKMKEHAKKTGEVIEITGEKGKYIINEEGEIETTSAEDVILGFLEKRQRMEEKDEENIIKNISPYKVKIRYQPTEFPPELEDDPAVGEGSPQKAVTSQASPKNQDAGHDSKSEDSMNLTQKRATTKLSKKATKAKKKSQTTKSGKKKKKKSSHEGSKEDSKSSSKSKRTKSKPNSSMNMSKEIGSSSFGNTSSAGKSATQRQETSMTSDDHKIGSKNEITTEGEDEEADILNPQEQMKLAPEEVIIRLREDEESKNKTRAAWSGQEVLVNSDPNAAVWTTEKLNELRIWKKGKKGIYMMIRHMAKKFITSSFLENLMTLCVLINTFTLAMDRYDQPENEQSVFQKMNIIFTSIFAAEMSLKIFALGLVGYLSDVLNYLDGFVVIFSLVEIIFLDGSGAFAAFRTLRIFRTIRMIRTLRVLRVGRLLRALDSMRMIIEVIGDTISSFAYIALLLLIMLFIFSLFGMQLYGGKFDFKEGKPRQNFDSFNRAFLTMFQVLTMENWQSVLFNCMRASIPAVGALFNVVWIFIGNNILLNLFLAIMLDAFGDWDKRQNDESKYDDDDDEKEKQESKSQVSETLKGTTSKAVSSIKKTISGKAVTVSRGKSKFAKDMDDDIDIDSLTTHKQIDEKEPCSDTDCEFSLFFLSKTNRFRKIIWKIVSSTLFEGVILTAICLGSIKLAVDTYFLNSPNDTYSEVENALDTFFTIFFALEALMKAIAYGFALETRSYLRDSWNQLDFFIVCASLIDLSVSQINIPMIKIMRLLRTFRPLRFVTHNANMRMIVTALFKSLGAILNTMIVVVVIWLMFAIVGVNFFAGKFQYCTVDVYKNSYKNDCINANGTWKTYDLNFDNTLNGIIFLFELTTQENWPITVYQAIDCTDVDQGPEIGSQWYYAYFFVIFLFIGSMFLLNLFVGVMFLKFINEQERETSTAGGIYIPKDQQEWIEVQKMILKAEPNYNARTTPQQHETWRKPFHWIITWTPFEIFIALIIILNLVQMAMLYEDASPDFLNALDIVNYIFTGIFTLEVILKLFGYSWSFWYDAWNIFDFFIVLCSYVDIIFSALSTSSLRLLRIGPQLIRVLRVLRVSRLLRLVKKYKRLQDIMEIIQFCLPSMMNVFSVLMLVFFIYAVLGCYLFGDITSGKAINDFYNFNSFGSGMILCLKMATGEDWNTFMYDCAKSPPGCAPGMGCGNAISFIYFITFKLVVSFIMLNLFILIVLQLFDKYYFSSDNIISKYKEDFEVFQQNWISSGTTHSGYMISEDKLSRFFARLPGAMGMGNLTPDERAYEIIKMKILSTEEKCVFFQELLFCAIKRTMNKWRRNEYIVRQETTTRKKIQTAAKKAAKTKRYEKSRKAVIKIANPFVSIMILRATVKMWKRYMFEHRKRVEEAAKNKVFNYESSMEEITPRIGSPSSRRGSVANPSRVYPIEAPKPKVRLSQANVVTPQELTVPPQRFAGSKSPKASNDNEQVKF